MAVMQHARNRSLREEVYRAYITRATIGDLDNTPIIEQILKLRLEKAKLLGYNNYAEVSIPSALYLSQTLPHLVFLICYNVFVMFIKVSMALKMATVHKAEELLEELRSASWNPAVQGDISFMITTIIMILRGWLDFINLTFWIHQATK